MPELCDCNTEFLHLKIFSVSKILNFEQATVLTLHAGKVFMIFLSSAELFKINYLKKKFHEYHKSVKNYPACKEITPLEVVQSVTSQTADPGVESSIPAQSHTFVEIDHEIISMVILFPSADTFKNGCCHLQAKVCARRSGQPLQQAFPAKKDG